MDVTFIIPVRNDAERLARCIDSIRRELGRSPGRVVVVDNGSTDPSPDVARAAGAETIILAGVPVAAARNRGVASQPLGDIIAFVDADHELMAGWFEALRCTFARPDVDAATAAYVSPPDPTPVQRWYAALRGSTTVDGAVEWGGAGNLAIRRTVFDRLGGFDENLEACEDVDLCFRLRQTGGTLWGARGMRSVHHGDPATLRHLFRGELWRGRDNIRVSLRGPWSIRSLVSMLLPVVQLLALPVGLGLAWLGRPHLAAATLAVVIAPTVLLRTLLLMRRARPRSWRDATWALLVSATYDSARALALVWKAAHHRVTRGRPSVTAAASR